jgi:DNA polymerase-3 subunit delta
MARSAGASSPIQAIVGVDTYLSEQALTRLLDSTLGPGGDRDESLTVLYGDEARWEEIVASAQTGSLFVSKRAIVVRRADQLKGDEERILAYAEDPAPDVTLVLMAPKPDRRRKVWKGVLAKARTISAQPKRGKALRAHVDEELRRRGLRIAPEGVEELIDRVGQDLRRLMGEVDKLEAFGASEDSLSGEDVAAVLGRGMGKPLYLLADAISARRTRESLELLDELMGDGEEGLRILATAHRALRQVRGALALREAGERPDAIGKRLLPANMQFKARALVEASRQWSDDDLGRAFSALGVADRRIKRGADAETALAAALLEAFGGKGATTPSRRGR